MSCSPRGCSDDHRLCSCRMRGGRTFYGPKKLVGTMTEFPLRQIGHTGLQVTELGLGCATLGGSRSLSRAAAEEIVAAAWDAGVRYVDTAPFYGVGQAERASATRCATGRATNGCCRPRSAGCCGRNPTGGFADGRRAPAAVRSGLRLFVRWHHALVRGQLSAPRPGADRHPVRARHRQSISTAPRRSRADEGLRESGYRALESLRARRRGRGDRHRRQRTEVLLEAMEWGALGRVPAGRPLHAAGTGAARRPAAEMRRRRHLDRRWRAAEFRHPRRPRHLELPPGPTRDRRAGQRDCRRVRRPPGAAAGGGAAVPAGPSGGRRDHPRSPQRREFNANLELLRHPIPPALWADLRQASLLHPEAPVPRPA